MNYNELELILYRDSTPRSKKNKKKLTNICSQQTDI